MLLSLTLRLNKTQALCPGNKFASITNLRYMYNLEELGTKGCYNHLIILFLLMISDFF